MGLGFNPKQNKLKKLIKGVVIITPVCYNKYIRLRVNLKNPKQKKLKNFKKVLYKYNKPCYNNNVR